MTPATTAIIGTLNLELLLGPLDELPAWGLHQLLHTLDRLDRPTRAK